MGSQGITHISAVVIHNQKGSQGTDLFPEEQGIPTAHQALQPLDPAQERQVT